MDLSGVIWSFVRPIIALGLLGLVGYLVFMDNSEARTTAVTAFTLLVGALWGERAALKTPGKDT